MIIRHLLGYPKRDHNFDNYLYRVWDTRRQRFFLGRKKLRPGDVGGFRVKNLEFRGSGFQGLGFRV